MTTKQWDRLKPSTRRIKIAEDVIASLELGIFTPVQGIYCRMKPIQPSDAEPANVKLVEDRLTQDSSHDIPEQLWRISVAWNHPPGHGANILAAAFRMFDKEDWRQYAGFLVRG